MTNSTVEVVKKCCCGQFRELSASAVADIKNRAGRDGQFLNWIEKLPNMSDHADANEIIEWLKSMPGKPKKVFITHGELEASEALAQRIKKELGWETDIPDYLEKEIIK